MDDQRPLFTKPEALRPWPIFLLIGGLLMCFGTCQLTMPTTNTRQVVNLRSPPPLIPARPSVPALTQAEFEQEREAILNVIRKGPNFEGSKFQSGKSLLAIAANLKWNPVSQAAAGDIVSLATKQSTHVTGDVVVNPQNPRELQLVLTGSGSGEVYRLRPTTDGSFEGSFRGHDYSGRIQLTPRGDEEPGLSRTEFANLRAKLVAVLGLGPDWGGSFFERGSGGTAVRFHIVWDSVSQSASGEYESLATRYRLPIDGGVEVDKENPTEVLLHLRMSDHGPATEMYLKASRTGAGLSGTYRYGYDQKPGTIELKPLR